MTSKQTVSTSAQHPICLVYKQVGETPLEALERLRTEKPEYAESILSYAGRLDPLASGLLLVLVDEANKQREEYLHLDKIYDVEVLCGISTDTYDLLGLIDDVQSVDGTIILKGAEDAVKKLSTISEIPYPAYSSKPVGGKSLFQWAREGRLDEVKLPMQTGKIKKIDLGEIKQISRVDLETYIYKSINSVKGDFRQNEILKKWKEHFITINAQNYFIISINVSCTSGLYMRSLCCELGKLLGIPALAFTINRTKVGDYSLSDVV